MRPIRVNATSTEGAGRTLRLVVLLGVVCLGATACSDRERQASGNESSRSDVSAASSTTTAGGNGGATSTPRSAGAEDDVWTPPGEPSPLELGTGDPEPEYPAGENGTVGTLIDGEVDLLVRQVDQPTHQVLVDAVVLIVGPTARSEAIADGRLAADEELVGNYYTRNPSPKLRGVSLASDVKLRAEKPAQSYAPRNGVAGVEKALIERLSSAPGLAYRARVVDGAITELVIPDIVDPTMGTSAGW